MSYPPPQLSTPRPLYGTRTTSTAISLGRRPLEMAALLVLAPYTLAPYPHRGRNAGPRGVPETGRGAAGGGVRGGFLAAGYDGPAICMDARP